MMRAFIGFAICLTVLVGCHEAGPAPNRAPTNNDGKVKVVAPGVDVEVQPKGNTNSTGKVKVNAPGVNVNVEKGPG